ncbi:MAG: OsmC family protein [Nitratireductor sp.]
MGGDPAKYNPEDMLGSTLSCHMLWYLHLCANAGIAVTQRYRDEPVWVNRQKMAQAGSCRQRSAQGDHTIAAGSDTARAAQIHQEVHQYCFIARSVNFLVSYEPEIEVGRGENFRQHSMLA